MMTDEILQKQKKEIRKKIIALRDSLSIDDIELKSNAISEKLWDIIAKLSLKNIMFYISFGSEIQTQKSIYRALDNNYNVIVPICLFPDNLTKRELLPSLLLDPNSELSKNFYGILEPKPEFIRPFSPENIDLVIVPGVAFDEKCYRIGYGAGYYDRFLPKCKNATKIALAYEIQIIENIHPNTWDIPVDCIITETRIINNGSNLIP